jgi:flagellar protein FlgJ
MSPLPLGEAVSLRDNPLDRQGMPGDLREQEHLAGQFEGVFVSMLLKEMRSTLEGGLFGEENSDTYGALFDMYLGQHLADSNALGIRELLMNQWKSRETANASFAGGETNVPI